MSASHDKRHFERVADELLEMLPGAVVTRPRDCVQVDYGALMATWSLIQALCHVASDDPKATIERMAKELTDIVKEYSDKSAPKGNDKDQPGK